MDGKAKSQSIIQQGDREGQCQKALYSWGDSANEHQRKVRVRSQKCTIMPCCCCAQLEHGTSLMDDKEVNVMGCEDQSCGAHYMIASLGAALGTGLCLKKKERKKCVMVSMHP